jgi:16S rRNA (uracil1498-N3)-methyltransferase
VRLTRVFVDAPLETGSRVMLPPDAAAHLTRVLRLGEGEACTLFNGRGGEYAGRIASAGRREVTVEVGVHDAVERESPLHILLLQGLARGERMDMIVQKATELGVAAIRPVYTEHSAVRLDERQAARKQQHWRAVAVAACEQCRRNRLPDVLEPLGLEAALAAAPGGLHLALSLERAASAPALTRGALADARSITLLVGPEGGFSAAEEKLAASRGFQALRLGPRVLRTETAALAGIAALQVLGGDGLG